MEKSLSSEPRAIAVFDYDHTLIIGDSMWPFLAAVVGWPRALLALAEGFTAFVLAYARNAHDSAIADPRTFIKAFLLRRLLDRKPVSELQSAIEKVCNWQTWNESIRKALFDHHMQGHHIVIISGALDLYLPKLVKDLPEHTLLCTQIETKDGLVTGRMLTGNCVRQRKAEILSAWLATQPPFADSWGYGNFPHDVPMLNLVKHRIIV